MYNIMDVTMRLAGPGEGVGPDVGLKPVGNDLVPLGKVALVLSVNGQDVAAFYGTPRELRQQVMEGFALPVPDGVDLELPTVTMEPGPEGWTVVSINPPEDHDPR